MFVNLNYYLKSVVALQLTRAIIFILFLSIASSSPASPKPSCRDHKDNNHGRRILSGKDRSSSGGTVEGSGLVLSEWV